MTTFQTLIFLTLIKDCFLIICDHWADDFNEAENCVDETLIEQYNTDTKRCTRVKTGSIVEQYEYCKKKLASNLITSCPHTTIVKVKNVHTSSSILFG